VFGFWVLREGEVWLYLKVGFCVLWEGEVWLFLKVGRSGFFFFGLFFKELFLWCCEMGWLEKGVDSFFK
jgi:hypothetical protein